jgi:hypothetical protein
MAPRARLRRAHVLINNNGTAAQPPGEAMQVCPYSVLPG